MKHRIPENIIEEIRSRADIVDIVSESVLLKKNGKNYKGLCPFHAEKTPSFTVSPEKQIYYCFGCGAGGNVFKFLMAAQDIPFLDAVKNLAGRTRVQLPSVTHEGPANQIQRNREILLNLNVLAAEYFVTLLNRSQEAQKARDYLRSRGFQPETLAHYQIGWASARWNDLATTLGKSASRTRRDLENAGLIKKKEGGSDRDYYDRFRGRIVFPLKDMYGKIIGFAGRVIQAEAGPKYLNSPETLLYKKGNQLFGLHGAREAIRKENQVLLVEGYFDQIRAREKGIRNVVATCGTALTPAQVALLKNHTNHAVLVFDSDPAGQLAAERGFELLLENGMNVKIVILPGGHDPDSFIRENGPEPFLKLIENAKSFVESYLEKAVQNGNIETPGGRMEVVNRVLPLISKIKNNLERTEWVRYLSEKLGVDDKALLSELRKATGQKQSSLPVTMENSQNKQKPDLYLIHLMLSSLRVARDIRSQISVEEFRDPRIRRVMEMFYALLDEGRPLQVDRLLDRTEDPEIKALLTRVGVQPILFDDRAQGAADCIVELKRNNLRETIKELKKQRNEAEKAGQSERSRELHSRLREIQLSLIPD
ncbi:MAG: DNA primase [Nitrospinaceae bacterium]